MIKRVECIQKFHAQGDGGFDGTLFVFAEIIGARTLDKGNLEAQGRKSIRTEDGRSVNRLGKGEYKIVVTGEILRSDASDAP